MVKHLRKGIQIPYLLNQFVMQWYEGMQVENIKSTQVMQLAPD